ncbi:hypothetical protein [Streptomyces sp. NPDC059928]|uniref:hypothetical protein n=1 Tax=unclassified Streptomyces TaxID=2593676 RepID=UPI00364ECA4A
MAPLRTRSIVLAVVLGLCAVLGIVWLVRSATISGQNTAGEGTNNSSSAGSGTDSPGGRTPDNGGTSSGATGSGTGSPGGRTPDNGGASSGATGSGTGSPGGRTPDNGGASSGATSQGTATPGSTTPGGGGRRAIHVNGVRLDGNRNDSGCLTVINKTSTAATIDSVSFEVADGPARPAVRSDDAAHCSPTGDPACRALQLVEGRQCLAGAVLPADAPDGEYTVTAVVHYTYVCDNTQNSPCSEVPDWGGPPPTPQAPVQISGSSSTHVPQLTMVVGGTDTSPSPGSPSPSGTSPVPASPSSHAGSAFRHPSPPTNTSSASGQS